MGAAARPARLAPLVLLAIALAGCAAWPWLAEEQAGLCFPRFPYRDGWLGGDSAYSVPLAQGRTLWLFGDSFVGEPGQKDRVGAAFVHNTVGLSRCTGGRFEIEYAWGMDEEGAPAAFLRDPAAAPDERWWWLFDGFVHDGALWIGLLEVEATPATGPLGLPFRAAGMQLARVANPDDAPAAWRATAFPLWESPEALPGSAFVVHGDWLHLFTFLAREDGRSPRALARLPLAALEDAGAPGRPPLFTGLEYLARDGRWKPGLDPRDARVVMDDDASEMSVHWREDLSRWLAVYSQPGDPAVLVRTAASLAGPWTPPRMLFLAPEPSARWVGGHDPATACYAAKEQRGFAGPGEITLTYVCNLFAPPGDDPFAALRRLQLDMNLYRPHAVRLALPEELRFD